MAEGKVLLVEDSEPLRKVLAEKIRSDGFDVVEAGGGEEGVKAAHDERPDVIVTDVVMFPVDGLEMAKQIRSMGAWGANVHIIALTNQNASDDEKRIAALDLSAYMVKSDTPLDDVVKEVKRLVKEKKK